MENKIEDFVVYKNNGICKITDISKKNFNCGEKTYYTMESVYDSNTKFFVPIDANVLLKQILSVDEINVIIKKAESIENSWIEDSKERTQEFNKILNGENRVDILWLVKMLSLHKIEVEKNKKKFYASDEKLLNMAEKIITEEFAFVLGLPKEKVIQYILEQISDREES